MKKWIKNGRCKRECFANLNGICRALAEVPSDDCPFQRTDITLEKQFMDIMYYNSIKSIKNG